MTTTVYDVVVIGAGVVGCAMARRFTLDGAKVLILEKSLDVLDGVSKGNSAILHTGFDAPPGSLEQACVSAGYKEYLEIAETLSLPIVKSGALVLAWSEEQLGQLSDLIKKAHRNGVTDVRILECEEIRRREPNLSHSVVGGFEVPGEYLIDPWTTAHAYMLQAIANGVELVCNAEVLGGEYVAQKWKLETSIGEFRSKQIINCAGLYGDIVDERLLGARGFTVTPRKGQFVVSDKTAPDLFSSIIFPVPTKTTKGIVICRTVFGNVLVGPTAEDQVSRTDSSTQRDILADLRNKGEEMLPGLSQCEITATYAGLRPATKYSDYQIRHHAEQAYVTVGGIRSTGLSAALGAARHVAEILTSVGCEFETLRDPVVPDADRLSNHHRRDWEDPDNGGIVCHCELVTRREIEKVLNGPMPPRTLQGLKRRTRVTMGQCQGFFCMSELAEITQGHLVRGIGCGHD